jgi:hypothetical protein
MSSKTIITPNNMSTQKRIEKNLALSADFNSYLLKNPKVMDELPRKVCIVFEDKKDQIFSKANLKTAEDLSGNQKCFVASKNGSQWKVRPLTVSA